MTNETKSSESERIVAAAGFILKQENIKAIPRTTLALIASDRCDKAKNLKPSDAGSTLNGKIGGNETNMLLHGNQQRAKHSAIPPRTTTNTTEKIRPDTHLASSRLKREIGRERIMRKVPSSASLATRSPPTSAAYSGISKMICGASITIATDKAER